MTGVSHMRVKDFWDDFKGALLIAIVTLTLAFGTAAVLGDEVEERTDRLTVENEGLREQVIKLDALLTEVRMKLTEVALPVKPGG